MTELAIRDQWRVQWQASYLLGSKRWLVMMVGWTLKSRMNGFQSHDGDRRSHNYSDDGGFEGIGIEDGSVP